MLFWTWNVVTTTGLFLLFLVKSITDVVFVVMFVFLCESMSFERDLYFRVDCFLPASTTESELQCKSLFHWRWWSFCQSWPTDTPLPPLILVLPRKDLWVRLQWPHTHSLELQSLLLVSFMIILSILWHTQCLHEEKTKCTERVLQLIIQKISNVSCCCDDAVRVPSSSSILLVSFCSLIWNPSLMMNLFGRIKRIFQLKRKVPGSLCLHLCLVVHNYLIHHHRLILYSLVNLLLWIE